MPEPLTPPDPWRQHARRNRLQSLLLLLFMACLFGQIGWLFWGRYGLVWMVLLGLFGVFINSRMAPQWVMRLYGARKLSPWEAQGLFRLVEQLAARAALRRPPALYYVPSPALNAFAIGAHRHAAIGITDGLLRHLDPRELAGVLAHEIAHIKHRDVWVMSLAETFYRLTHFLSFLGLVLIFVNLPLLAMEEVTISWGAIALLLFAPNLCALAQLALSRTREYDADLQAARLTGDPAGLASALATIERVQGGWLERIFMAGRRAPNATLLRTHPATTDRIARLRALQGSRFDQGPLANLSAQLPLDTWRQRHQHPWERLARWF